MTRLNPPRCFLLLLVFILITQPLRFAQSLTGVFTAHNDNARTGQNLNEIVLTPQNVNSTTFGKQFSYSVDGAIYAQPLYVPNVEIPGQGTHNVVYVTTQNDSVYAFDADGLSSVPLWQDSFIDPTNGIMPVYCQLGGKPFDDCSVYPMSGILGTPVINHATQTLYLVARTRELGKYFQRLHALDITDGTEKFGGPVVISGSVLGTNGIVEFDPSHNRQRAALLFANGLIYIGWAGSIHGWLMGYDAGTLAQHAILSTSPNATKSGIWQSGAGLAGDANGNIYAAVGDGLFDGDSGGVDYGDSVLKLGSDLSVSDYFTPMDQACRLEYDQDLGSSGPILLPAQPGDVPNELVIAGKGGAPCSQSDAAPIYLLNQDDLGKYNPVQDQIVETVTGAIRGYWGSPAYWQSDTAANLYLGGLNDTLKMYDMTDGLLSKSPVAESTNTFRIGTTPSVSAHGTSDGIVWAVERQDGLGGKPMQNPAILRAYDATNVANSLYSSAEVASRDQMGCATKFSVPTVANGRVYVGTQNELDVFGILNSSSGPNVHLSWPCHDFFGQAVNVRSHAVHISLTNSGTATMNISSIALAGVNADQFALTSTCNSTLAPGESCMLDLFFSPTAIGIQTASVMILDDAPGSPHNIYLLGNGEAPWW